MNIFLAYNWTPNALGTAALREAFERLTDQTLTIDQTTSAFLELMRSKDLVARGLAFDHYFHAGTTESHFPSNPYEKHDQELLIQARNELRSPPVDGELPSGEILKCANHASALQVLWRLSDDASTEDISTIERFLREPSSPTIQRIACQAAHCILSGSSRDYPSVLAILRDIASDEQIEEVVRASAVNALADWSVPGTEEALAAVAVHCTRPIASRAAYSLLWKDDGKHREFIRELLEAWPRDDSDVWMNRGRSFFNI